jgi:hypothetical protein
MASPRTRRSAAAPSVPLAAIVIVGATPASAYDTVLDAPLREVHGGRVVGTLSSAVPRTVRFLDARRAEVAFRTAALELRGVVDLAEGAAQVRSARRLVLGGAPFRIEVEPGTSVSLTDGARGEVRLDVTLPVEGLVGAEDGFASARPRLHIAGERLTAPDDSRNAEPCAPLWLWSAPRVGGPVIRTVPYARLSFSRGPREGWREVRVHDDGIVLRGFTWMAPHCGAFGAFGVLGTIGRARVSDRGREVRALIAGSSVASSATAPWTVRVLQSMDVELVREGDRRFFLFPLGEGMARIEGVIR